MKTLLTFFLCIGFIPILSAQSLLDVIADCQHIKGNVESTVSTIKDYTPDSYINGQLIVQQFDKKNRLLSTRTISRFKKELEAQQYYYVNNLLMKEQYSVLGKPQFATFYQYHNKIPMRILKADPAKKLLVTGNVFLDSLYRPTMLKAYNMKKELLFTQTLEYGKLDTKVIMEYVEKNESPKLFEYQLCADDIYIKTINEEQFEDRNTKILNLTLENNMATIVKAVNLEEEGKEEIFVQEIEFDKVGNWITSKQYKLKKRKEKKVLVLEINRDITYR